MKSDIILRSQAERLRKAGFTPSGYLGSTLWTKDNEIYTGDMAEALLGEAKEAK